MGKVIECCRCILSNVDDPFIKFNENGLCGYCQEFDLTQKKYADKKYNTLFIESKLNEIKLKGKGKKYDSILGLSGGVDSSFLAYWAKEKNLRPLIVHFDNGWNSELAIKNIESVCTILGFELQTIVIDWDEFKNLQLAYFKSGVVDIECASDHAILATLYNLAFKNNIHYILAGTNYQTECIMPKGWNFSKQDYTNLKNINKEFGNGNKLKSYPTKGILKQLFFRHIFKVEFVEFLNYIEYDKNQIKTFLKENLDWRDYGGKHYESQFTKIYQSYILPTKFGVDKRKAHLSNLICSKTISKEEAINEIKVLPYDQNQIKSDISYLIKKWGITIEEFDSVMEAKPIPQDTFGSDIKFFILLNKIKRAILFWN
jgi:N-acetyl sugar amidotransferase